MVNPRDTKKDAGKPRIGTAFLLLRWFAVCAGIFPYADISGAQGLTEGEIRYAPRINYHVSAALVDDSTTHRIEGLLHCSPLTLNPACYDRPSARFSILYVHESGEIHYSSTSWSSPRGLDLPFIVDATGICVDRRHPLLARKSKQYLSSDYILDRRLSVILAKQFNVDLAAGHVFRSGSFSSDVIVGLEDSDDHIALRSETLSNGPWIECRIRRENGEAHEGCTAIYDPQDHYLFLSEGMFLFGDGADRIRLFFRIERIEFKYRDSYLLIDLPRIQYPKGGFVHCYKEGMLRNMTVAKACKAVEGLLARHGVELSRESASGYADSPFRAEVLQQDLAGIRREENIYHVAMALKAGQQPESGMGKKDLDRAQELSNTKPVEFLQERLDFYRSIQNRADFVLMGGDAAMQADALLWALAKRMLPEEVWNSDQWRTALSERIRKESVD
ncbi:MAG TPA: hypothetical protein PLY86_19755 [bacterium]|nr:hypothetical protein [bacterium]